MHITFKQGRRVARSACLLVIMLDGVGTAWAQLPYTPLTTPLHGGSASQPPEAGGGGFFGGGEQESAQPATSAASGPGGASGVTTPARPFELTPHLRVRETYSDNINLQPADQAKSDFITEIVPGFNLKATGKRVRGSLDYNLQGVIYGIHGASDHVNNQVAGHALGEVLPSHLFLSTDTTYSQAVINPSAPSSSSGIFATGNTADVWVVNVNPYWLQSLGPVGNARLDYTFGHIQYGRSSLSSSHSNTYRASLTSPQGPGKWSWSGDYRRYQNWQSDGYQTLQQDVSAQLGYQLFNHFRLLADGGWEQNQQRRLYSNRFQGSYWAAGFAWDTDFNTVTFKYGHRFFGPTYEASWRHRAARLTTDLSYKETVTLINQDLQSQAVQSAVSQQLPNVPLVALNSQSLYISRRFAGSVRYAYARTSVGITGYDERRHYLNGQGDEHVTGAALDASWKAGERTSVRPSMTWEHGRPSLGATYTLFSPQIAVNYTISDKARAEAGYRYEDRESSSRSNRYKMNMVYAGINISF